MSNAHYGCDTNGEHEKCKECPVVWCKNRNKILYDIDDVCEWKIDGVYLISPHKPLISCVIDKDYRYFYCPYCGKKIKVVE